MACFKCGKVLMCAYVLYCTLKIWLKPANITSTVVHSHQLESKRTLVCHLIKYSSTWVSVKRFLVWTLFRTSWQKTVLCCSDHTEDDLQGCSYSKYNLGIPQDTKYSSGHQVNSCYTWVRQMWSAVELKFSTAKTYFLDRYSVYKFS